MDACRHQATARHVRLPLSPDGGAQQREGSTGADRRLTRAFVDRAQYDLRLQCAFASDAGLSGIVGALDGPTNAGTLSFAIPLGAWDTRPGEMRLAYVPDKARVFNFLSS
jgi:hypothetical protein